MRRHAITALLSSLALSLTACGGGGSKEAPPKTESSAPTTSSTTEGAKTADLPNLVGKGLQSAQDAAQAAGFYVLASHDSLGRGRNQVLDRDWKVCFQTPGPARRATDTKIDLGVVKLDETCPEKDQKEPTEAAGKMPDFRGKSVKVARDALDPSTSITVTDASGQDRNVLVESNWKVCSQKPAAGAELTGQPVTLTAVKFEESCP
ncbi:Stk1 family PASTA domain-containing Ser/Thr kinase [Streptomyces massasporeus]|uniref:Stk1 family PASTA domain-containing Ser/Thr kinase n=1 Tax=Streptomyces massasporeus TaxID=67324 RepID=UPI0033D4B213